MSVSPKRSGRVVDRRAHEAGHAVDHDLRHRAHRRAEDRRAARHRFDEREPEALGPRRQVHERERAAEQFVALRAAHVPDELHRIAVDQRLDPFAKIRLVVRNAGQLDAHAGSRGRLDRQMRAFLGMKAPEKEQIVTGPIDEGEALRIDAVVCRREIR